MPFRISLLDFEYSWHFFNWNYLSYNPNAIELLKENQDKIDWDYLSFNINAIELLKKIKIK